MPGREGLPREAPGCILETRQGDIFIPPTAPVAPTEDEALCRGAAIIRAQAGVTRALQVKIETTASESDVRSMRISPYFSSCLLINWNNYPMGLSWADRIITDGYWAWEKPGLLGLRYPPVDVCPRRKGLVGERFVERLAVLLTRDHEELAFDLGLAA